MHRALMFFESPTLHGIFYLFASFFYAYAWSTLYLHFSSSGMMKRKSASTCSDSMIMKVLK